MLSRLARQMVRTGLAVLVLVVALFGLGIAAYAMQVRASARALVDSARGIHTTADAEREIASWRKRLGKEFWMESDHLGGDHNYDGVIDNLSIARLGILEPAGVMLGVTMRGGELRCLTLTMTTGRTPSTTAHVWVQEWFDSDKSSHFHVVHKDKPLGAVVEFSTSAPEAQRTKALDLNTKCFVQFNGCKSAEDILPFVWRLGPAESPD